MSPLKISEDDLSDVIRYWLIRYGLWGKLWDL